MRPFWFRTAMNLWPPFRGAGIRVEHLSADFRAVDVRLQAPRWKRNYVGTHFGGSLYAMTDPFYMLMLMHNLGRDYWVWDKTASIDYLSNTDGPVWARFRLDAALLDALRAQTAGGDKALPQFHIDVRDRHDELIATVHRTLYVRLKKDRRPAE